MMSVPDVVPQVTVTPDTASESTTIYHEPPPAYTHAPDASEMSVVGARHQPPDYATVPNSRVAEFTRNLEAVDDWIVTLSGGNPRAANHNHSSSFTSLIPSPSSTPIPTSRARSPTSPMSPPSSRPELRTLRSAASNPVLRSSSPPTRTPPPPPPVPRPPPDLNAQLDSLLRGAIVASASASTSALVSPLPSSPALSAASSRQPRRPRTAQNPNSGSDSRNSSHSHINNHSPSQSSSLSPSPSQIQSPRPTPAGRPRSRTTGQLTSPTPSTPDDLDQQLTNILANAIAAASSSPSSSSSRKRAASQSRGGGRQSQVPSLSLQVRMPNSFGGGGVGPRRSGGSSLSVPGAFAFGVPVAGGPGRKRGIKWF